MRRAALVAGLVVLASSVACEFHVSTARVEDAWLAADEAGTDRRSTFRPDETVRCLVDLANAPESTSLRIDWMRIAEDGTESLLFRKELPEAGRGRRAVFSLIPDDLLPSGRFRADLFLDGDRDRSLEFTVGRGTHVARAWLARDEQGRVETTVFAPDDVMRLHVDLGEALATTETRAEWRVVEIEGAPQERLIDAAGRTGRGPVRFSLTPRKPFPRGRYRVDLFLDGQRERTVEFEVRPFPRVTSVVLTRDEGGEKETTEFGPDEKVWCHVRLADAGEGAEVRGEWRSVEVENGENDRLVDTAGGTFSTGTTSFSFSPEAGTRLPAGTYRIDLHVNGKLDRSVAYRVR